MALKGYKNVTFSVSISAVLLFICLIADTLEKNLTLIEW